MRTFFYLLIISGILSSCISKKIIINNEANIVENISLSNEENMEKQNNFENPEISNTFEYIEYFKDIAMQEMIDYGIPASITLAQGILESGSGKGRLAVEANNHFGIKCHKWDGDKIFHDDDKKNECFRKYKNPQTSFRDHSVFLTTRSRYEFLFDFKIDDYVSWSEGLKKAGYATDPNYPQKLINIIERYKLYEYDKIVVNKNRKK
jgi:flagellum-specific peptidoglycan hydrolase FlgJ